MERCPPEILSRIFVLACMDGGRIGGVLRLVSKRIAAQAKPYRFCSVQINGIEQTYAFERAVLKFDAPQRRVEHLMISDKNGTQLGIGGKVIPHTF
jgi:hypothetical protein